MTDLSHWDFADRFRGKEAAELIMGIPPEANDGWEQILGGSNGFTAKITPVLRRMEHALNEAGEQLYQAAVSGIPVKEALEVFPLLPHGLQSETMLRARTSETEFGLSLFKNWHPKFDGRFGDAYFTRSEIDRWLHAIGMQSAYQFVKSLGRNDGIFNLPDDVSEEFRQWLLMETWPYESAMWLLAGVIPREIYEGMGFFTTTLKLLHNDNGEKDEKLHKIGNLKRLWLSNPANPERAAPLVYLMWAAEKSIDIEWLESVRREGYLLPDETRVATEQKPLGTTERNTLLTIIAVLCNEAKIPYEKPSKAAALIQSTAAKMGVSIGETTIEGHLKKIPDALATRMK